MSRPDHLRVPMDRFTIERCRSSAPSLVLFLITYVPWLVLVLPNLMMG